MNYFSRLRSRAFKRASTVYGRTLPNVVLNVFAGIILLGLFAPLMFESYRWSAEQISKFNQRLVGTGKSGGTTDKPDEVFSDLLVNFTFGFLILFLVTALVMFVWMYFSYRKLNGNSVENKTSILYILARSITSRVKTILAYVIIFILISFIVYFIYFQFIALIYGVSRNWGSLAGFLGFFVMVLFFMRFIMIVPDIVNGDEPLVSAMKLSYKHLSWNRSGLFLLLALILTVSIWIIMFLIFSLMALFVHSGESDNAVLSFIIAQLMLAIIIAAIGAFVYAELSSVFLKYSGDK
jgi:hypothetical protein